GDALLDVVGVRWVADATERYRRPKSLPDPVGQLVNRRGDLGAQVEVLVDGFRPLDAQADPPGQVAAISVVTNLPAVTQQVQGVLAAQHLLDQVGNDMAHRQADVAAQDLLLAQGSALADADAVERPDDRVRQAVLLPRPLGVVFRRQLLKAVGRRWGGA